MNSSSSSAGNRTLFYPFRTVSTTWNKSQSNGTHALTQCSGFRSLDHSCVPDLVITITLGVHSNRLGSIHQLTKHSSPYFRAISWCLDTHFGENTRLPTVLTSLPQFSKYHSTDTRWRTNLVPTDAITVTSWQLYGSHRRQDSTRDDRQSRLGNSRFP
ncbi:hypothetical protein YC2023_115275 [Brassica napus]